MILVLVLDNPRTITIRFFNLGSSANVTVICQFDLKKKKRKEIKKKKCPSRALLIETVKNLNFAEKRLRKLV